jgi:hypothetical protein
MPAHVLNLVRMPVLDPQDLEAAHRRGPQKDRRLRLARARRAARAVPSRARGRRGGGPGGT